MFLPSLLLKLAILAFHLTLKFDILLITSARRVGQGAGFSKPYVHQPGTPRNGRRPATHLLQVGNVSRNTNRTCYEYLEIRWMLVSQPPEW